MLSLAELAKARKSNVMHCEILFNIPLRIVRIVIIALCDIT